MVEIKLSKLEYWNPFKNHCWRGLQTPITIREINTAISKKILRSFPIKDGETTRGQHIQRIAYLIVNVSNHPIDIDVGIPELNYCPDWIVCDGNHRLAAAFYRNDKSIFAEVSGSCNYAKELLGVDI